ncbi:membrane protein insertion efficiency factor YidD [Bacillus altitudinis]|nr:membrane protein insertion efficiency factor YidD [Bacillus altitudinis]
MKREGGLKGGWVRIKRILKCEGVDGGGMDGVGGKKEK